MQYKTKTKGSMNYEQKYTVHQGPLNTSWNYNTNKNNM